MESLSGGLTTTQLAGGAGAPPFIGSHPAPVPPRPHTATLSGGSISGGAGAGACAGADGPYLGAPPLPKRQRPAVPSSSYVGVTWAKKARLWKVAIKHDGETQKLGTFADAEAAARAYDDAARRLRGDKAHGGKPARGSIFWRLNFPTAAEEAAASKVLEQQQETKNGCPACAGRHRRHTCGIKAERPLCSERPKPSEDPMAAAQTTVASVIANVIPRPEEDAENADDDDHQMFSAALAAFKRGAQMDQEPAHLSPESKPRRGPTPGPSYDQPDQCPVRRSQGKVRENVQEQSCSCDLIGRLLGQWVLNRECSCGGGRMKLQAPTKIHRDSETGEATFVCTHTLCRSFFGGVCPHFQMCPHCRRLRSCNSMSNGVCRAGKGCRRIHDIEPAYVPPPRPPVAAQLAALEEQRKNQFRRREELER